MNPSKAQRWLDLLALLVGNRLPISFDEIMEQVPGYRAGWIEGTPTQQASARRKFERDKDQLRRLGIPIETRRYRVEGHSETDGYVIPRRSFYLPYLELVREGEGNAVGPPSTPTSSHAVGRVTLSEPDVRTAILALREVLSLPSFPFERDARSALRKLTFDLDPRLSDPDEGTSGEAGPPPRVLERPGGADPKGALGPLLDALYDRSRVRFRYHSIGRDAVEPRRVEPWGLLFQWGAWYLAGRDVEKGSGARLFRLDRMGGVERSSGAREFDIPEDFDLRAYAGRKAWHLGDGEHEAEQEVVVRFFPAAALLAVRNEWGVGVGEETDGSVLRAFSVRRTAPFLRWILSMAGEARIVSPPDLRDELVRMAAAVRRVHGKEWEES